MARHKKNPDAPVQEGEQAEPATEKASKASAPEFVFVGDQNGHGPQELQLYGLIFVKKGPAVEVDDPAAAKKLAANSHFKAA
jgi:hypothetical protein